MTRRKKPLRCFSSAASKFAIRDFSCVGLTLSAAVHRFARVLLLRLMKYWLRVGVQVSAKASEVSSETVMVTASARKKTPVHAGDRNQRQEHHDRSDGRADQRHGNFAQGAANRLHPALSGIAVQDDVFDHHDGVVDHQAHRRRQAAQRHQVETSGPSASAR